MKITIEFDADKDVFQENAAKRALNADNAYIALLRTQEMIRKYLKYSETKENLIEELNQFYTHILEDCDINLDILE